MLFQVDENCDLAAFTIGYELDSSHGFILPHTPRGCPTLVLHALRKPIPLILGPCRFRRRGEFTAPVKLHKDVTAHLKVVIEKEAVAE